MSDQLHWTNQLPSLRELIAVPRLGIISDFDGTLSEFADSADEAIITEDNARALDQLAEGVTLVALVSGRATADLRTRFERQWMRYYGSHGLDRWHENAVQIVPAAEQWQNPLRQLLAEFIPPRDSGVYVENKGVTASVHFRLASDPENIRLTLMNALEPLCARYGFVLSEGRFVWEIKPPLSLSKGTAVQALVEECQLDGALFLGDDVTDLSAMAYLRQIREQGRVQSLSVGVTHDEGVPEGLLSSCDMTALGPGDVARLLMWIANAIPTQPH